MANHRQNERTRIRILKTNYICTKKRSHDFKRDIFNELHKQPIQCNRKNQNTWILNQTIINRMNFFQEIVNFWSKIIFIRWNSIIICTIVTLAIWFHNICCIVVFLHKNPTIIIIVHRNRLTVNFIDQNCVYDVTFNKYAFNCCL